MPGLLSKFRTPLVIETDPGPALPPVPVENDRARTSSPVRLDDAAGPALPPAPMKNDRAGPPSSVRFDDAVPALPPETVKDVSDAPVLPSQQSLLARLLVKDEAGGSATPEAETTQEGSHNALPAVRKKKKRGRDEPQQEVVVQEQAANPQPGNPLAAQNIVVNVNTTSVGPYWGWGGCWAWSCPHRRGLPCRRWWCW
jgi:hypothetical protein